MNFKRLAPACLALLFASMLAVSCGDDDPAEPSGNTPEEPVKPEEPSDKEALTPTQQKEKMEAVALDFMKLTPASDFENLAALSQHINDTYVDGYYEWGEVEDWASRAYEAAKEATGLTTTEKEEGYSYLQTYVYTHYNALLLASNFTGHFKAAGGKWTLTKANDLQFEFNDQNGKTCVLAVKTSGKVTKVHAAELEDWIDYDYEYKDGFSHYTDYIDLIHCTIGVPETIEVTLTQAGATVVKTTVNVNLSGVKNEEFDISSSNVTAKVKVELNNGYTIDVNDVAYTGNTKASTTCKLSKSNTTLATMAVAADVHDLPACNVSAFTDPTFDDDDYKFDNAGAKNAFIKLDIMGRMQIQGTVSDVRKYAEYLDEADRNDENEASFKSYINQANGLSDIHVFYDNSNVRQASVKWEPFYENYWGNYGYWTAEPVIYFADGSSYSTFSAFFNDKDFKTVINTFKALADKYAGLVNEEIDW